MRNMQQLLQLIIDNKDRKKNLRAEQADSGNVLYLYDIIDPWFGVTATDMAHAMETFGGADFEMRINSPGGDVFEGRAIQTRLKQYPGNIHVMIDGLAASAATTVALGGKTRTMAAGAFFMVHNSWTLAFGNRHDVRKTGDLLEQIDDAIGADYAAATGKERDQIVQWMDDETWFSATDAKANGFIQDIYTGDDAQAAKNRNAWNLSAYKNVPKALTEQPTPEPPQPDRAHMARYLDMLELGVS
ncbi:head maturation protease, ClpP-related [Gilvimarinus agarilyticus]|uniref:head maturation protease, ClpP-related n=1 Tax=Gilvimarinus agarilyticus TaxID=679259 RepID=UPI000695C22D|nr:head maturation protease, ClpP-related [Gilvimarinus agarilyticus]